MSKKSNSSEISLHNGSPNTSQSKDNKSKLEIFNHKAQILINQKDEEIKRLNEEIDEAESILENLNKEYREKNYILDQEIQRLEKEYSLISKEAENEIKLIKNKNEEEINNIKQNHELEIKKLTEQLENTLKKNEEITLIKQKEKRNNYENELNQLKNKLKLEKEKATDLTLKVTEKCDEKLKKAQSIADEYLIRINSLESELENLKKIKMFLYLKTHFNI